MTDKELLEKILEKLKKANDYGFIYKGYPFVIKQYKHSNKYTLYNLINDRYIYEYCCDAKFKQKIIKDLKGCVLENAESELEKVKDMED